MSWDLDRDDVKGVFCDDDGSWDDIDHRIDNIMSALNHAYRERDEAREEIARLRASISKIASGNMQHRYEGLCPDSVDPDNPGDPECPVCRLVKAEVKS